VRPVVPVPLRAVAVGVGHEQSPRAAVDLAEALAGLTNGRGVDDRQGLGDVLGQHPVEQRFVAVLQRAQMMCLSRSSRRVENSCQQCSTCWVSVFNRGRQQPQQTEPAALVHREGGAFVVKASNSLACPRCSSDIDRPLPASPFIVASEPPFIRNYLVNAVVFSRTFSCPSGCRFQGSQTSGRGFGLRAFARSST